MYLPGFSLRSECQGGRTVRLKGVEHNTQEAVAECDDMYEFIAHVAQLD